MPNEVPERYRRIVTDRSMGHCERCGTCQASGGEISHRQPRALKNHRPSNLARLCPQCHHGELHAHPEQAMRDAWIISRHDPRDPSEVPVEHWLYGTVLLDDQGGFTLTERTADATER